MANRNHILAYIGIMVLVTWLGSGLIPAIQAHQIILPGIADVLLQSLIPALLTLTMLLPSVVSKPSGVPSVETTQLTPAVRLSTFSPPQILEVKAEDLQPGRNTQANAPNAEPVVSAPVVAKAEAVVNTPEPSKPEAPAVPS